MSLKRSPFRYGFARLMRVALCVCAILIGCEGQDDAAQAGGRPGVPTTDGGLPDGGGGDAGPQDGGNDGGPSDGSPAIVAFSSDPSGLLSGGGTATLSWEVIGADELSLDQGVGAVSGSSTQVQVTETTTFTLTATNDQGTTTRSTAVLVATDGPPPFVRSGVTTSVDLIDEALSDGAISDVDALRYKVFALFGDERLPPQFVAEGRIHGTRIMKEVAVRFEALPQNVQDELRPFRLPPSDPASWYDGYTPPEGLRQKQEGFSVFDRHVDVADDRVRVWWESSVGSSTENFIQGALSGAIAISYDSLVAYMGRLPLPATTFSDLDPETYHVYVVINESRSDLGWLNFGNYDPALGGFPSDAVINLAGILDDSDSGADFVKLTAATAAHELMHGIQSNYDTEDDLTAQLLWLEESTATWAEHFVFKDFDTEHRRAADLMHAPEIPLDGTNGNHAYGGYLLHMFLQDRVGMFVVRDTWDQTEDQLVFEALNKATGNKLAELWGKFTAFNWNDGPVPFHIDQDGLTVTVGNQGKEVEIEVPEVLARQEEYEMTLAGGSVLGPVFGLDYLSARYFHFKFSEPSARTILFANGYTFKLERGTPAVAPADETYYATKTSDEERKGAEVYLLVKSNGAWLPEPRRVTDVAFIPFCQDYAEERIDELVVIFSNSRFEEGKRTPVMVQELQPQLFVSNFACGDWVGNGRAFQSVNTPTREQITDVTFENMLFERDRYTMDQLLEGEGQVDFLGTVLPEESSVLTFARYSVEIAAVDWRTAGTRQAGDQTCAISGMGVLGAEDAEVTFFELRPTLFGPTVDDGSIYRSFFANLVFISPSADVVTDCGPDGLSFDQFNTGIIGGRRNLDTGPLLISEDGVSIVQSWEVGDIMYELDLLGFSD